MSVTKVLVAVDWSSCSQHAVRLGDELAESSRAALTLMHVVPFALPTILDVTLVLPPSTLSKLTLDAQTKLEALTAGLRTPRERLSVVALPGDPVDVLVEASRGYDVVVVGTHGRKGAARVLMGSIAERVTRGAHSAVLVARGPSADAPAASDLRR